MQPHESALQYRGLTLATALTSEHGDICHLKYDGIGSLCQQCSQDCVCPQQHHGTYSENAPKQGQSAPSEVEDPDDNQQGHESNDI